MNKKTRWSDIPEEFISRCTSKGYFASDSEKIIGEFNCLQQIKPGDIVRFLNNIYPHNRQWAFDQPRAHGISPDINSGIIFYFDAVAVKKSVVSKYDRHLAGYFLMPENYLIINNYGPHALADIFVSSQDRKNQFDIKLIEDLYKIGYGYSLWTTLTDHTNFIPIKVFKS